MKEWKWLVSFIISTALNSGHYRFLHKSSPARRDFHSVWPAWMSEFNDKRFVTFAFFFSSPFFVFFCSNCTVKSFWEYSKIGLHLKSEFWSSFGKKTCKVEWFATWVFHKTNSQFISKNMCLFRILSIELSFWFQLKTKKFSVPDQRMSLFSTFKIERVSSQNAINVT